MSTSKTSARDMTERCLREFLVGAGKDVPQITDATDLIQDIACQSDEGVDFVLDLCDIFQVDLPDDFNPFVHESGKRGRRFGELIAYIEKHVTVSEEV